MRIEQNLFYKQILYQYKRENSSQIEFRERLIKKEDRFNAMKLWTLFQGGNNTNTSISVKNKLSLFTAIT